MTPISTEQIAQTCQDRILEVIKTAYLTESEIRMILLDLYNLNAGIYILVRNALQDLKKKGVIHYNKNKIGWELL